MTVWARGCVVIDGAMRSLVYSRAPMSVPAGVPPSMRSLPAASFAEKDGTFTNTERKVQRVRKAVSSPGEAREDWKIICDLSTRMGYPMAYDSAKAIFEEISRLTPSYCGINFARLERDGIYWPCTGTDHPGTPCLHMDQFTCGLGVFHGVEWMPPAEMPDDAYPLYLTTGPGQAGLRVSLTVLNLVTVALARGV